MTSRIDEIKRRATDNKYPPPDMMLSDLAYCLGEIERLKRALEFYADPQTWDPEKFLVGSDRMRDDLEETEHSRFTPGKRARQALEAGE